MNTTEKMHKATMEKLNEATARIDRIIYLTGAMANIEAFPDDLNQFLDDVDDETITECFGDIPEWVDLDARIFERTDYVYEWLRNAGKYGFLVQFATPVMTPHGATIRSFSWGLFNTKWIYAESLEDAITKGLSWVESRRAKEDAKAGLATKNPDDEKNGATA